MKNKHFGMIGICLLAAGLFSCHNKDQQNNAGGANNGSPVALQSKNGIGAAYGSRDPRTCVDRKQPTTGVPDAEQVKEYFICTNEHLSGDLLYLVSDVKLELGKPRPFMMSQDGDLQDIDATQEVLPVRGSYKYYQIGLLSRYAAGQNTAIYNVSDGSGMCWKNSYGEWQCSIGAHQSEMLTQTGAAPQEADQ